MGVVLAAGIGLRCSGPGGEGPAVQIAPQGGQLSPGTEVRLESSGPATIYYTLDETRPDPAFSLRYEGALRLWSSVTLRAMAVDDEGRQGPEAKATFRVDALFPLTRVTPASGNYREQVSVTLRADETATIHYTVDGTAPTLQSPIYTGALLFDTDTTLRFFAVDAAGNREPPQQESYNFPPRVTVTPPSGIYQPSSLSVSFASNEDDATLSYNVVFGNGVTGAERGWNVYRAPLTLTDDAMLQIRGEDAKGFVSQVQSALYAFFPALKLAAVAKAATPLAAVAVDLDGFDRPGLVWATRERLWIAAASDRGYHKPVEGPSLSFVTAWLRSWDVDGDGLNDILVGDTQGKVHLFLSLPGPKLQLDTTLLASLQGASVRRLLPLDANRDGQLDILALDSRAGASRLLLRTPGGYQRQAPLTPAVEAGALEALAGDFNNDRRVDLLVLPGGTRAPYVLFGDEKGGWSQQSLAGALAGQPSSIAWLHAARSDMDGDGELDLVLVGRQPGEGGKPPTLRIVLVRHLDGPYWRVVHAENLPDRTLRGCSLADLDADGAPDVILWSEGQPPLVLTNVLGQRLLPLASAQLPSPWPAMSVGVVGPALKQGLPAALGHHDAGWRELVADTAPRFLHLLLQGIRGNRNGIGAHLQILHARGVMAREIGVRSTGPDQSSLFFPIPVGTRYVPTAVRVLWSDGQVREVPQPPLNQTIIVRPN